MWLQILWFGCDGVGILEAFPKKKTQDKLRDSSKFIPGHVELKMPLPCESSLVMCLYITLCIHCQLLQNNISTNLAVSNNMNLTHSLYGSKAQVWLSWFFCKAVINGLARTGFSSEAQLKTPLLSFLSSCDYWHHSLYCRLPEWPESNHWLLIGVYPRLLAT